MAINTKKFPRNLKKIPYYLLLSFLTTGASLILGLLSFGGMYALIPSLSLAFATFGLSVAYEGEIYLQNIKGAFKKLFKSDYLKNYLAKEYLLHKFPEDTLVNIDDPDCPQFFKDYKKQRELLNTFNHKKLSERSKQRKKHIEKTLEDMEKWFALQLFAAKNPQSDSAYELEIRKWLANHDQNEKQARLEKRQATFNYVKGFSILAASFMGLGSTYLIAEAFSVIPLFAAIPFAFWPIIIVPMALIAGVAYGVLTYNTITDLINNDTINTWCTKLRNDFRQQGPSIRNLFMATMAVFLASLAIALTVCTAGTWWTVATHARPLFEWMRKMPSFIMGIINPTITGLSTISFNIQNSAESLEMLDSATSSDKNIVRSVYESIAGGLSHVRATENWLQILNPFRLLLKLTLTPLHILLFMGHLVSIALTSDRMPGVPQTLSVLVGMISEGFEDAHYFVGDTQEDQHEMDIPSRLLKIIASPLYALAAAWDCLASKVNPISNSKDTQRKRLTFAQAWNKQRGKQEDAQENAEEKVPENEQHPSKEWRVEHTLYLINKYEKKHFNHIKMGTELAEAKRSQLEQLKERIRTTTFNDNSVKEILSTEKNNPVYNQHRLFALYQGEKTETQEFLEELSERVYASL